MLAGFVLLLTSCTTDCRTVPVSETIFPTLTECQQMAERIRMVRPQVILECAKVRR